MTIYSKELSEQYLDAVDRMNAVLRNLQLDYMELILYDHIISGDMEYELPGLRPSTVLFRVRENFSAHLTELEKACKDMRSFIGER